MSKIKVNEIEKASGSGITIPTGTSFTVADGIAASSLTGTVAQANIADQAINEAKLQVSNAPTNGYMLTAQSGNTGGLTWAEASSGKIGQIVHTVYNNTQSQHNINNQDQSTNFIVQITPSAANSTILVQGHIQISMNAGYGGFGIWFTREVSGQSNVTVGTATGGTNSQNNYHSQSINTQTAGTSGGSGSCAPFMFTDTPNTTSQVTYRLRVRGVNGCGDIFLGGNIASTGQKFITPFTAWEILA